MLKRGICEWNSYVLIYKIYLIHCTFLFNPLLCKKTYVKCVFAIFLLKMKLFGFLLFSKTDMQSLLWPNFFWKINCRIPCRSLDIVSVFFTSLCCTYCWLLLSRLGSIELQPDSSVSVMNENTATRKLHTELNSLTEFNIREQIIIYLFSLFSSVCEFNICYCCVLKNFT